MIIYPMLVDFAAIVKCDLWAEFSYFILKDTWGSKIYCTEGHRHLEKENKAPSFVERKLILL